MLCSSLTIYCSFCSNASVSVNTIKDMLAGLTEFQEGKNSYTLHLNMTQECMNLFQRRKLIEVGSVEQVSRKCQVAPPPKSLLTRHSHSPLDSTRITENPNTSQTSLFVFWMTIALGLPIV